MIGRVRRFNDYPCVDLGIPAFSQRAVDALRDLLEPNGELLPLISDIGQYWAFNVTTVADVLDWKRSQIRWLIKPDAASSIERHEFFPSKLRILSIFRIPEIPHATYVTELFAARVREHGLEGFDFRKVWPLPPGVIWWKLAKKQKREYQRRGLPKGKWVKGNTVVIRLLLSEDATEPARDERRRVEAIMNAIDDDLVDVDARGPAVGNLEGHEYPKGECRLFLSCPDADVLARRLVPWLRSLEWEGEVKVLKRYGEYVDSDAPEAYVDI